MEEDLIQAFLMTFVTLGVVFIFAAFLIFIDEWLENR